MQDDLRRTFAAIHHQATGEILHLLDGFYVNLEDGLFELADRLHDQATLTASFELMRELRVQRPRLLRNFTRFLEADQPWWWIEPRDDQGNRKSQWLRYHSRILAKKRSAHFNQVLCAIAERTARATRRDVAGVHLPVSPDRLTYNFLRSCPVVETDRMQGAMIQNLFGRLVLDRLGTVYGLCNARLALVAKDEHRSVA